MNNEKEVNAIDVSILLTNADATPASQLSWIVRGFLCNVCHYHLRGTIKRAEAVAVATNLINSALQNNSIAFSEHDKIAQEITNIETNVYPGCSLI